MSPPPWRGDRGRRICGRGQLPVRRTGPKTFGRSLKEERPGVDCEKGVFYRVSLEKAGGKGRRLT
jgi:hypothetical protein